MAQNTISQKVADIYRRTKKKSLLFASDFHRFDQDYVGDLLSKYVREEKLVRLAKGMYLKTDITRFGPVYPSPAEIADAIARRDHAQVLMSGLAAENYFGLSTQVPMKMVFLTSGSARKIDLGDMTLIFKRGVPRNFAFQDKTIATLYLALKSIGEKNITEEQLATLKRFLLDYTKEHNISNDMKLMSGWMIKLIKNLLKESNI